MKHISRLFFLSLITLPFVADGFATPLQPEGETETSRAEQTDSVSSVNLQEVVVQGCTQRVIKYGVEYIPDKKTKRNSMNATNLLLKMQIPQLYVDPFDESVKTMNREDVSFFIDYNPASTEQLSGLRPEDVVRVEVLDYPQDPRFQGAIHVVNFIMQHYEWGGYTKFDFDTHFLADNDFTGSVYSKFAYKKWTFDVNAYYDYNFCNRNLSSSTDIYRDIDFLGRHYDEITRTSSNKFTKNRMNNEGGSLRAQYQTQNFFMLHSVSFGRNASPVRENVSGVSFSIPELSDTESRSLGSSQSITPSITGYYWFVLPKRNFLSLDWGFSYGATKKFSNYQVATLDPIINNNREKVYSPNLQLFYTKVFPRENTLRIMLFSYASFFNTSYFGSYNDVQKLVSNENMLFLEYMKNWGFGLSLYSRLGASYVIGRVNGVNTLEQWNPRLGFQLEYKINEKHSASLDGWWGNSHPHPSTANDALVQSNELLWLQGNPDLRNTLFCSSNASYTYIPTNKFSLSATLSYEGNPHKQAYRFYTIPGHDGLVRQSVNSGEAHQYYARVSATLRLFDNSFSIRAGAHVGRTVLTGIDAQSLNYISGNINAQYMRDNWSVALYYNSPHHSLGPWDNGTRSYFKDSYGVSFSYAVSDFKASVKFNNWFRKDYLYRMNFDSPLYSFVSMNWASNLSRIVYIDLSYTIPYGKKINRNNELGTASGVGSAILQ